MNQMPRNSKKQVNYIYLYAVRIGILAVLLLLFIFLVRMGEVSSVTSEKTDSESLTELDAEQSDASETIAEDATALIAIGGDIMAHDAVTEGAYDSETDSYDFTQYFTYAGTWFQDADLAIANLETTFGGTASGYPMFSSPDDLADSLKELGFDLLTTANNHCMDSYSDGVVRTIEVLDAAGIDHVGTNASQEAYDENMGVVVEEVNGITIAFLDYTYGLNYMTPDDDYLVNLFNLNTSDESEAAMEIDTDKLDAEMEYARSLNTDLIIVMMHWGTEYDTTQSTYQEELADYLIARGADAVIGGHAHVPQPMEYRTVTDLDGNEVTGFVCYSLGNLISNMSASNTYVTAVLNLEITRTDGETVISGVSYEPMYLLNPGNSGTTPLALLDIPAVLEDYDNGISNPYVTESLYETLQSKMTLLSEIFGSEWDISYEVLNTGADSSDEDESADSESDDDADTEDADSGTILSF